MTVAVPSGACHVGGGTFNVPYTLASASCAYQTTMKNASSVVADCVIYLVIDGATTNVTDSYETQWQPGYTRRDTTFKTIGGLASGSHTWDIYLATASAVGSGLTTQSCAVDMAIRGA